MAAPSETYVDPSIAGNSGAGTVGDPYGDLQYALDTMTRDASNGDRINIKEGTDEILSAVITLATYGSPTTSQPIIFQGYTSAAGDGGIGGIDGNGNRFIFSSSYDAVFFIDMHMHNCATNPAIQLDNFCGMVNVELNNVSGSGVDWDSNCFAINCYFHDISGVGIYAGLSGGGVANSHFANGTKSFTKALSLGSGAFAIGNTFSVGGSTDAIDLAGGYITLKGNSILSAGGTGSGVSGSAPVFIYAIEGNVIEGFSGSGGVGFDITGDTMVFSRGHNAAYNNATNYVDASEYDNDIGDNETLSGSGFAKSGSDTFANRFTYFAPADTGNVIGGLPNGQDKGAVQSAGGGGGGVISGVFSGTLTVN